MIFRQLFEQESSTYTYLLADEASKDGVIIDPVVEMHRRDAALIRELGIKLIYSLDTHCHADHITGSWQLKEAFGCKIGLGSANRVNNVDNLFDNGETITFGKHSLKVLETPGHTDGCVSFVLDDQSRVFTGDSLLIRGCGRTDFQGGDPAKLYQSIQNQLFTLPEHCLVYPGHDYNGRCSSSIGEEKAFNPRIGGAASEKDFVGYMKHMKLPHPKKIAMALPANLNSGRIEGQEETVPQWAPLEHNFGGILQIDPQWLANNLDQVVVVDVRDDDEFNNELGHLPQALHIPLGQLEDSMSKLSKDKAIVTVCRSGRRSALASLALQKAGFEKVANLKDGMLAWTELGFPIAS
ncbi:MBL fold metallo-hydrolase [Pseudobacteriovorax antillogorgiicola]|uniref:Glyoxylase, beta-lactamase superfamily II n=1 Tax=Pseudobacteriovorax antillogorgiicola TaxID=1513793 RepID=A0A1Y6BGL5_9BACT|nr:MBL fold metallo-hydrolase [Pseudobacteriovorax antillogorgiicola]TCS57315.1 glyoxylase-like metal-dependent hydrolase (beta-lactamase superfamily II) [Pseudobacteriovorax antillogorgiicola]SMF02616.1 Glyoxylase, beta-lactamase superfamily II [Pseudobacteriovorax antillogorgiicola]